MNNVYLAGGFQGNWHQRVTEGCSHIKFTNPSLKEIGKVLTFQEYTTWDLHHIKSSDILFAYISSTNPSCIGLSLEIGYAKGLNKTVILVIENETKVPYRYLEILKGASDIYFDNLQDGIDYLKMF